MVHPFSRLVSVLLWVAASSFGTVLHVPWVSTPLPSTSHGLVLAGNPQAHREAVRELLVDHPHLSNPQAHVTVTCTSSHTSPCASLVQSITSHFAVRCTGLCVRPDRCEMPWTLVWVDRAELAPTKEVNALMRWWGEADCKEVGVFVGCSRVLFVLSTSFGANAVLDETSLVGVQDTAQRELRRVWTSGRIFAQSRRWVKVVVGPRDPSVWREVVARQNASRTNNTEGAWLHSRDTIDLGVLDNAGFVGQATVLSRVRNVLDTLRTGAKTGGGPVVLLFVGPAGAGKTMLAQLVARAYSGGAPLAELEAEGRYLFVDMGNYQDERAADGFVDPSPGLQGEGILSNLFQRQKRTVVVFDEVEKGHHSLLQRLLLPVLDTNNGHITKKKTGRSFATKDAIFILTSNCFDDIPLSGSYVQAAAQFKNVLFAPDQACTSAQNPQANPFAPSSLQQRLRAGLEHVGGGSDGFLLFRPPSVEDVRRLVEILLRNEDRAYAANDSIHARVRGLYWTPRALDVLQQQAIARVTREAQASGLRTVTGVIKASILPLLKASLGAIPSHHTCVLVLHARAHLDCSLVCDEVEQVVEVEVGAEALQLQEVEVRPATGTTPTPLPELELEPDPSTDTHPELEALRDQVAALHREMAALRTERDRAYVVSLVLAAAVSVVLVVVLAKVLASLLLVAKLVCLVVVPAALLLYWFSPAWMLFLLRTLLEAVRLVWWMLTHSPGTLLLVLLALLVRRSRRRECPSKHPERELRLTQLEMAGVRRTLVATQKRWVFALWQSRKSTRLGLNEGQSSRTTAFL